MGRKSTVAERLSRLLETGKYSDQEFLLKNGETLKGHKVIFAVASPVFDVMLYGNLAQEEVIIIEDIDADAFKSMAKFIYTDELDLDSTSHAMDLYRAGDKYDIPDLQKETEEFIYDNIKTDNALEVLKFSLLHERIDIENKCFEIIQNETHVVLNSKNFFDCDTDILEIIVNSDRLDISEIELFNSIDRWAKHKALKDGIPLSSIKTSLKNVIAKIRFLTMDVGEFSSSVNKSELLTTEEKLSVLVNLCAPNSSALPDGFSNSVNSRCVNSIESSGFKFSSHFDRVLSVRCEKRNISQLNPDEDYDFPVVYFYNNPFLISIYRGLARCSEDNSNNDETEFLWTSIYSCSEEITNEVFVCDDDVLRNVEVTFKLWGRNKYSNIQSFSCNFSHSSVLVTPQFSVPFVEWDELMKDGSKDDDSFLLEVEMKAIRETSQMDK